MSGWQTVYLDTVNETNARALAARLGSGLQSGQFSDGDRNYCFLAYTPLVGKDDAAWGFAVLARFNTDFPEGLAAYWGVLATAYVKTTPASPSNKWAS